MGDSSSFWPTERPGWGCSGRMTQDHRSDRRKAMELAGTPGAALRSHARRVASLAVATAEGHERDGLSEEVELTALLHDVGKVAMPYRLLQTAKPLDEGDWAHIRRHTIEGEELCNAHGFDAGVGRLVRATHERWDGRGYPDGLAGHDIPLAARIVFCAD